MKLTKLAVLLWIATTPAWGEDMLSLEDFLQQVKARNQAFQSSKAASEGAALRAEEGDLLLSPYLFANVQQLHDEKPTANPAAQGDETTLRFYSLGVGKTTSFGTQAKLSYSVGHYDIEGANPSFLAVPKYYEAKPMLEISQSLWRDRFGNETSIRRQLIAAQATAAQFSESFKTKLILADAESAYWRLVLSRDAVSTQKQSLERAKKIRDWNERRVKMQLTDQADLLQSDAAVKGKELELKLSNDEEAAASRSFNRLRGKTADNVGEALIKLDESMIDKIAIPASATMREDIKSIEETAKIAALNADAAREKYKPTLEVFGSYALNGKDEEYGDAQKAGFKTDNPTTLIGIRLNAPLGWSTVNQTLSGYALDQKAANEMRDRRKFEVSQEWQDLNDRLNDTKARMKLVYALEKAQKLKMDFERDRQSRGRSTTFQVLNYEQDYAEAQMNRIRTQAALLQLVAQMKTFAGGE